MQLILLHPEVAFRSCEDCQKYIYKENGEIDTKDGEPLERYPGIKTPCRYSKGCPKGTPENSRELTEQNYQCWQFLRECRAVHQWPDDLIVRRNAAVLELVEQQVRDMRQQEATEYIKTLARMVIR